ncbi:MAG: hypothetical protein ACFE9Q_11905 [Candidatus Hodarchaeota archaeon]
MRKEKLKNFVIYFNIVILVFGIVFLLLNIDMISVVHAKAGELIPVEVYETYSTLETSLIYILILFTIVNMLSIKISYLKPLKPYIISLTPIVAILSILLFFLNPHTIILSPKGWPPTHFDYIEIGGTITIILFSGFIGLSIFQIYLEGIIKNYFITVGLILGGLLLSDFIHEGGHAIITLLAGGEINAFYPFPVLLGGEFAAGYVGFSNVPSNLTPLVTLGGEIFQWMVVSIILIILYFKPKYRKNVFILTLLFIGLLDFPLYVINNSIGLPHWFLVGGTYGDIMKFSDLTGFPMWAFIILACVQLVITGLIFYKLFKNRIKGIKEDNTIN